MPHRESNISPREITNQRNLYFSRRLISWGEPNKKAVVPAKERRLNKSKQTKRIKCAMPYS